MPSERVQRRIEGLLDQAEEALASRNWSVVLESARMVLEVDPENEDAQTFLTILKQADSPSTSIATDFRTTPDPESTAEEEGEKYPEALEGSAVTPSPISGGG